MDFIAKGGQLSGTLTVPGDKSISHRIAILGALAEGTTSVCGFLPSLDCLATVKALQQLGASISFDEDKTHLTIEGVGLQGLRSSDVSTIDCQNAGTSMRLLAGVCSGLSHQSVLTGDDSLQKRPMARIVAPLREMGAEIVCPQKEKYGEPRGKKWGEYFPPLTILGKCPLNPISYDLPIASAQVKSCLLLAGLFAKGTNQLTGRLESRNHTENLLQTFEYPLQVTPDKIAWAGLGTLKAKEALQIPADISSAAFFLVGAAMMEGAEICLKNVGINPTRLGVVHLLKKMGAKIVFDNKRHFGKEPVADILVKGTRLKGISIEKEWVASTLDEFPALFVACATAQGETVLQGASELRVKESDRLQSMAHGLKTLGVPVEVYSDGIRIQGVETLLGGEVDSFFDHRVAMAFAMASMASKAPIVIKNCDNIDTSFPNFDDLAKEAGLALLQK